MIKKGFTLAEVLITLSIVGVIAAVTIPTFTASTTTAQIGPKLAKAVSMFEQANTAMLNRHNVDSLTDGDLYPDNDTANSNKLAEYGSELRRHLKIDQNGISKDGVGYIFDQTGNNVASNLNLPPHAQRVGEVRIDINGANKPNRDGTDRFYFSFWNDGSLRPKGATSWMGGSDEDILNCTPLQISNEEHECYGLAEGENELGTADRDGGSEHWEIKCPEGSIPTDAKYCAGHIFENNLKVLYK